ncbi:sulfur oxidation c-type cytochrome SoxX [Chenggangzhangella methanolivorans]|uniref:Sulfur oxidation c-type cytochrome SoxX n=1 Tax=Chenggangzhangella methanolivorans TaxID=1437009 RepID=A0A9E6UMS8_9HYPH|nr:sulfur oxidation c-type cytochrome SoxX [Chenggangzhangella methanolivorans]QZO00316.1 sulfur oxidation c-type cytochrome SoxX [Chenggangzhangella methanolivorans]
MARAILFLATLVLASSAHADGGRYEVLGDEIPKPLTDQPGDPARGRAIVVDRRKGLCLLCHSGPFPEERFQGDLAPSLEGAGDRNTPGALRLRLVDSRRVNTDTIMPPYFETTGLHRVAPEFRDKTILNAQEIEDVIAFLATLKTTGGSR